MFSKRLSRLILCLLLICTLLIGAASAINVSTGKVTASSSLNLRTEPSTDGDIRIGIPSNANVHVYSQFSSGWCSVTYNGLFGYVNGDYLNISPNGEGDFGQGTISGEIVNVREDSTTESSIITTLSKGTKVSMLGVKDNWYKVKYNDTVGYVSSDYLTTVYTSDILNSAGESSDASELIAFAKKYIGYPYVYGGSSPRGFDCSGFTSYVYRQFGVNLNRSSGGQLSNCTRISKSELQPGDLVFFSGRSGGSSIGHVAIYIGDNKIIHATNPRSGVTTNSLSERYYTSHYICCGRVNQE